MTTGLPPDFIPTDIGKWAIEAHIQQRIEHVETEGEANKLRRELANVLSEPIDLLQKRIGMINHANGWRDAPDTEDAIKVSRLALITTEVAEAIESVRNGDEDNLAEELADIVIRALDFADIYDINLVQAIQDKLARNRERGYRHGGKRI